MLNWNIIFLIYWKWAKIIFEIKIGVIDLETLQINNEGEQCVFAGGWAVSDYYFT